jgi:hypothetical protein
MRVARSIAVVALLVSYSSAAFSQFLPPPGDSHGRSVHHGTCSGVSDCAVEIPRTGNISRLFAEVDSAVAQWMKMHCVGAAVLAISRHGELVFKRGYGRMVGASVPDSELCALDEYHPQSDYVAPDTPAYLGSATKLVTAVMARRLVAERVRQLGATEYFDDPTQARLLDPELGLLPPHLLGTFTQGVPGAECPPVAVPDPNSCVRWLGCDVGGVDNGPDVRWEEVTIGDLIAHSSGWVGDTPGWETYAIPNAAAFRGYDTYWDWVEENDELVETLPDLAWVNETWTAREYLAEQLDTVGDNVFFVNTHDRIDGEDPADEVLRALASLCLTTDPAGASDSNPPTSAQISYANTNYSMLDRVIAHLSHELGHAGTYAGHDGFPEQFTDSALDVFLDSEGIEAGIETEEGILTHHPSAPDAYASPLWSRRSWSDGQATYYPLKKSYLRPFCVWDGEICDFSPWMSGGAGPGGVRLPRDFATTYFDFTEEAWVEGAAKVLFNEDTPRMNVGAGGLAGEAPIVLELANRYFARHSGMRMGRLRAECPECTGTGSKGGEGSGLRAAIYELQGGGETAALPPLDAEGRFTLEPDPVHWVNRTWTEPDGVDFVVAINQSSDELGLPYGSLSAFVRYRLGQIDWEAVDQELANRSQRIAGMSANSVGDTQYWYEDGWHRLRSGSPAAHHGHSGSLSASAYGLPSTRLGIHVVGVATAPTGAVYAWYDDGRFSSGSPADLGMNPERYELPSGQHNEDLVELEFATSGRVRSWYRNGTVALGTAADLDAFGTATFTPANGQATGDIVGISVDRRTDRVWTRYADGSLSYGIHTDLDSISTLPPP